MVLGHGKGIGKISDINEKTWEFFEKTWEILGKTWEIFGKTWEKILEISDVLFLAREKWRGGDESEKRKTATSVSRYDNLTRTLFVERRKKNGNYLLGKTRYAIALSHES